MPTRQLIQLIVIAAVVTNFGCSGQKNSKNPHSQPTQSEQGKAERLPDHPVAIPKSEPKANEDIPPSSPPPSPTLPTETPTFQPAPELPTPPPEPPKVDLDYQKLYDDLGLINPAPSSTASDEILRELESKHEAGEAFPNELVKKWIDQIRNDDRHINVNLKFGNNRSVELQAESSTLIQALKTLMVEHGVAKVPFGYTIFNSNGEKEEASIMMAVDFGGDLIAELQTRSFNDASGQPCHNVLCVLASAYQDKSGKPSETAAYQSLFSFLQFKYALTLLTIRDYVDYTEEEWRGFHSEFNSKISNAESLVQSELKRNAEKKAKYLATRGDYRSLRAEQVDALVRGVWSLPKTFQALPNLITVRSRVDLGEHVLAQYLYEDSIGTGQMTLQANVAMSFGEFDLQNCGNGPEVRKRSFSDYEVKRWWSFFEKRAVWPLVIVVHEMTHALDKQTKQNFISNEDGFGISMTKEWFDLSGWQLSSKPIRRNVNHFSHIPNDDGTGSSVVSNYYLLKPSDKNFVRAYGQTNPKEDLATSMELAMFYPELAKKYIPLKYQFLQDQILHGRKYPWNPSPILSFAEAREYATLQGAPDYDDCNEKVYDERSAQWVSPQTLSETQLAFGR